MGDFAEPNGPNLNACCLINTKGGVAGEVVIRRFTPPLYYPLFLLIALCAPRRPEQERRLQRGGQEPLKGALQLLINRCG